MTWKPISDAPRDGTVLVLGHVNFDHVEYFGRWGVHKNTNETRWVDGHGNGLFDATHFDYHHPRPKDKTIPGIPIGVGDRRDPHGVESDPNRDVHSSYDRADLLGAQPEPEPKGKKKTGR